MKRVVVGTAGHIDHGKTSLVFALTGIDADRLKEEKDRGITIDIGFADLSIGDLQIGFVDVPGHERFVRNMLAGAHGIDLVMLVVAADEGLMPQTREHFDICRLLEVKSGLVVITKCDLVDAELLELVRLEIAEYVAGSFLDQAPVVEVSSKTGAGIAELKATLARLSDKLADRDSKAIARLPIDRAFTIKGFGAVVTGTLVAGTISLGEELQLHPADGKICKVRGLQVHGKSTKTARAGERTAINLQGVELEELTRGQVLSTSGLLRSGHLIDVKLNLLPSAAKPLRNRSRVRLYHGTSEVVSRVIMPGRSELQPGETAYTQLRLEAPILALPGDRFIIRSYSPAVTIGGGSVVDVLTTKHHSRNASKVLAQMEALDTSSSLTRIEKLLGIAGPQGCDLATLVARTGLPPGVVEETCEVLVKSKKATQITRNPPFLIDAREFDAIRLRIKELLRDWHTARPLEAGMGKETLREKGFSRLSAELFRAAIDVMSSRGEIVAEKDLIRLASHKVALTEEEEGAKERISQQYRESGFQPPLLEDLIRGLGTETRLPTDKLRRFASMLINAGTLVKIGDHYFHRDSLSELTVQLKAHKELNGPQLDVGIFKEITGVSRKYAIPLLEYLDRSRVTRRTGETREIV